MSRAYIEVVGLEELLETLPNKGKVEHALERISLEVEREAKRRCPVRTGRLRASIHAGKLSDLVWYVGTNVEYAPYVEYGTRKMSARPYLRPAARAVVAKYRSQVLNLMGD